MSAVVPVPSQGLPPGSGMWHAGVLLGGRYKLLGKLGAGAMGEVWRAEHVTLGSVVAVKLVDVRGRSDAAELLARFHQEARAAAQLKSPHVVQILDHGVDGTIAFMAMELLEGESLEQRIARRGTLLPTEVAHIVREASRGVARAHAAGIVHRDLKPPNVFLARDEGVETVKVLDFGVAKVLGAPREAHFQTQQGFIVGTPAYMSPEQVLGRPLDARSDLWQMAVIAYECLCGVRPFEAEALGELFMQICVSPIRPLSTRMAHAPPGLDAWMSKALDRRPEARFQTVTELSESLSAILAPAGVGEAAVATAHARLAPSTPIEAMATGRTVAWSTGRNEQPAPPRSRLAPLVISGAALLVLGASAGLYWALGRGGEAAHPAGAPSAAPSTTVAAVSSASTVDTGVLPPATSAPAVAPPSASAPAPSASARKTPAPRSGPSRPASGSGAPDFGF